MPQASAAALQGETDHLARTWDTVTRALQARIRAEAFQTWFRRSALVRCDDHVLAFAVQNDFARNWIVSNYLAEMGEAARDVFGSPRQIVVEVDAELVRPREEERESATSAPAALARPRATPCVPATPMNSTCPARGAARCTMLTRPNTALEP